MDKTSQKSGRGRLSKLRPKQPEQAKPAKEINHLAEFPAEDPYPVLRIAKDGTLLYSNQAGSPILKQWQCEQGRRVPGDWFDIVAEALSSQKPQEAELECEGKVYSLTFASVRDTDFVNVYGLDITARKQSEEEHEVMIKLLSLINSSNKMRELMKLVLTFLKDWSGCEAVGIRFKDGDDFPYYVTSGFDDEFILAENKLCSVNELGELVRDSQGRPFLECMCGNVISGRFDPSKPFFTRGGSFWTNCTTELLASTTEADRLAKTRNRCNTAGYESVALVPLRAGKETFGLLQFNDKRRDRFTPEKISLFERLADNFSIGLAQRKAEAALSGSRERLQAALDAADLGTWDWDLVSGKIVWEGHHAKLFGFEESEFDGRYESFEKRVHPEDLPVLNAAIEKARRDKTEYLFEYRVIWPDGNVHWVQGKGRCQYDNRGRAVRMLGVVKDITERKKAEQEIKKNQELLKQTGKMAKVGGWEFDVETHNQTWTEEVYHIHEVGLDYKPTVSSGIDFYHPEDREIIKEAVRKVIESGEPFDVELRFITAKGNLRWVHAVGRAYRKNSKIVKVGGTFQDITERKQAEERHQTILKTALDGFTMDDLKGKILEVNDSYCKMVGYTREELLGMSAMDVEVLENPEDILQRIKKITEQGSDRFETRHKRKDGQIINVEVSTNYLDVGDGQISVFVRDITERKKAENALRESEEKFRSFVQNFQGIAFRGKMDFTPVFFHGSVKEITGYTEEEFVAGKPRWDQIIHPDDLSAVFTDDEKKLRSVPNYSYEREYRIVSKDGQIRWVHEVIQNICDESGKPTMVQGAVYDIAERKKAEASLQESEEHYRAMFEQAIDSIVLVDPETGNFQQFNDKACRSLGYTRAEFEKLKLNDIEAVESPAGIARHMNKVVTEGMDIFETKHKTKSGELRDILISTKMILVGDRPLIQAIFRDVTERKKAKLALQESEIRYRELFESMSSGVAVYEAINDGADFIFKNLNKAGERIDKIKRTELIGKKVTKVFPGVKEIGLFDVFQRVWRTGKPEYHPVSLYKDKRLSHRVENYVYKLPSDEIVTVYDDVTERKQAEENMIFYQNKLKSLASQLALSEEQGRRRIAVELHDHVGQALAFARLELDAARQSTSVPELANKLQDISKTILNVIDDLHTLSFNLSSPVLRECGLEAAISDWLDERLKKVPGLQGRFIDDGQEKPLDEDVKAIMFRGVRELVTNVIKHALASKLEITAKRIDDKIQVVVQDNGIGFDTMKVADRAARKETFGLFSIEEQLSSLGGECKIISEPGEGTTAILITPLKKD